MTEPTTAHAIPLRLQADVWEDMIDALGAAAEQTADDIECDTCSDGQSCELHDADWSRVTRWRALAAALRHRLNAHQPAAAQPDAPTTP